MKFKRLARPGLKKPELYKIAFLTHDKKHICYKCHYDALDRLKKSDTIDTNEAYSIPIPVMFKGKKKCAICGFKIKFFTAKDLEVVKPLKRK